MYIVKVYTGFSLCLFYGCVSYLIRNKIFPSFFRIARQIMPSAVHVISVLDVRRSYLERPRVETRLTFGQVSSFLVAGTDVVATIVTATTLPPPPVPRNGSGGLRHPVATGICNGPFNIPIHIPFLCYFSNSSVNMYCRHSTRQCGPAAASASKATSCRSVLPTCTKPRIHMHA